MNEAHRAKVIAGIAFIAGLMFFAVLGASANAPRQATVWTVDEVHAGFARIEVVRGSWDTVLVLPAKVLHETVYEHAQYTLTKR